MKSIYLELDNDNIVIALTESVTPYKYCEVEEHVELEEIVAFLELDKYVMQFENDVLLIVGERKSDKDLTKRIELLEKQLADEIEKNRIALLEIGDLYAEIMERGE